MDCIHVNAVGLGALGHGESISLPMVIYRIAREIHIVDTE